MGEKSKKGGWCGWIIALVVVAAAAGAIVVLFMKKHNGSGSDAASGASEKKYGDALKIAMQFFDVQKCKVSCDILKLGFAFCDVLCLLSRLPC